MGILKYGELSKYRLEAASWAFRYPYRCTDPFLCRYCVGFCVEALEQIKDQNNENWNDTLLNAIPIRRQLAEKWLLDFYSKRIFNPEPK
jgi:hypothetical protein